MSKERTLSYYKIDDRIEMQPPTTIANTANTTITTTAASDPSSSSSSTTTNTTISRVKTSIHVTALDGIANVNSLLTMAIFIGFSLTIPETATAAGPQCITTRETIRRHESSNLKLTINQLNNTDPSDPHKADLDPDFLKYGLFGSAIGSIVGCAFLMLSIVDFIQVKLGVYSCRGKPVYGLVVLVVFAGLGILVYVSTAVYASFFVEVSSKDSEEED
ncbi:hypothetical protein CDL12_24182 [Handroanthus impetiginosus]|uniref:Transmembrane protein n=1 Tax=Handroanthus impetiginosus TaxID=429701 RepID=A0A2G9GDC4_9LAMI|nr:hypothetical protein CDL12_24182 [Handroanthus impetiginosus]